MDRAERAQLREQLTWLKPGQHVEVRVEQLRALLNLCDQLERYQPDMHYLIALEHWRGDVAVESCTCTSCEGFRAQARIEAARFTEALKQAERAIEMAERGKIPRGELVQEGPRAYVRKPGDP